MTVEPIWTWSPRLTTIGRGHLAAVEVGAVGRAEVLDVELVVAGEDAGVDLRRVVVVEGDLAAGGPPDRELVAEGVDLARHVGRFEHGELGWLALTGPDAPGRLAGGGRWRRGRLGQVDLGPHGTQHAEEEQVQQHQQADLEDVEQGLGHRATTLLSTPDAGTHSGGQLNLVRGRTWCWPSTKTSTRSS